MSALDLVVALAVALRNAQQEGDTERARILLSTLQQELHHFRLGLDPAGETCPALIYSDGRLWPEALERLGVEAVAR